MIFDIALKIFLFLSPIIYKAGEKAFDVQLQFFQFGIMALFICSLFVKEKRALKDKWLGGFLIVCFINVFHFNFHPVMAQAFLNIFLGAVLYYLVFACAKDIRSCLKVIITVSILNTILAGFQFFKLDFVNKESIVCGFMNTTTHLGQYSAVAIPLTFLFNPYLALIPFLGLCLSKSITPFVAFVVGIIYFFRKKLFNLFGMVGFMSILSAFAFLIIRNYQYTLMKITMRGELWFNILKETFTRPFLGFGLGSFPLLSAQIYARQGQWDFIYNEYLGVAFSVGILGAVFFILFLWDKFRNINTKFQAILATSCVIVAVICLGQSPLHFARMAGTIIPLFAFLEILKNTKKEEICDVNSLQGR